MPNLYLNSGSISDLVVTNLNATGSLLGTASFALSASWAPGGAGGSLVVAAGGSTETVSTLVFSNAGGISWGINGGTITAAEGAYRSYYENIPVIQGTTAVSLGGSSMYVQPFLMPYDVSISYIRIPVTNQFSSLTLATTNNTTVNFRQTHTYWFNIYSAGNGASSRSLQYLTQGSFSIVYAITGQQGAASANQTVSHAYTYPGEGGVYGNFATNYSPAAASLNFSTTHLTAFTGYKFIDIPFNTSLASGQWWIGVQRSSVSAQTGATALANATNNNSLIMISQIAQTINNMGLTNSTAASVWSTNAWQLGLGYWSTNSVGRTTDSVGMSQISVIANQPRLPFQFIRQE